MIAVVRSIQSTMALIAREKGLGQQAGARLPTFWAWLLAIKNVTIIPFTLVWLVTMVRDALRDQQADGASASLAVRPS